MLKIENLHVWGDGKHILKGVNLKIGKGELHFLFGPNGSGKSTLVKAILGFPGYKCEGKILWKGENILDMPMYERVKRGIGVAFQNPPKIEEISFGYLLQKLSREKVWEGILDESFLKRPFYVDFSGGEKKRGEIVQLLAMNPDLIILDEIDSGVDVDSLKLIGRTIQKWKEEEKELLVITHQGSIMQFVEGDVAHVMIDGRIMCSQKPDKVWDLIKREGYRRCIYEARGRGI